MANRFVFYCLKLPLILVLITGGLLLEFLIELPFMIAFYIDGGLRAKR